MKVIKRCMVVLMVFSLMIGGILPVCDSFAITAYKLKGGKIETWSSDVKWMQGYVSLGALNTIGSDDNDFHVPKESLTAYGGSLDSVYSYLPLLQRTKEFDHGTQYTACLSKDNIKVKDEWYFRVGIQYEDTSSGTSVLKKKNVLIRTSLLNSVQSESGKSVGIRFLDLAKYYLKLQSPSSKYPNASIYHAYIFSCKSGQRSTARYYVQNDSIKGKVDVYSLLLN